MLRHEGQGEVKRAREEMVFHFPHYQSDDGPHSAIYLGNLKLLRFYESDRVKLFDLSKDIGERNDLSSSMPNETATLKARLAKYLKEIDAQMATMNPNFDPSKPIQSRRGGKGGDKGDKGGSAKGGSKGGKGRGDTETNTKQRGLE